MAVHKTCQLPTRLKPFFYNCLPYSLSPFFLFNAEQHSRKLTLNSALKLRRHSGFSAFFVLSLSNTSFRSRLSWIFFFFRRCCSSFLFGLIPFFSYALAPFTSGLSDLLECRLDVTARGNSPSRPPRNARGRHSPRSCRLVKDTNSEEKK